MAAAAPASRNPVIAGVDCRSRCQKSQLAFWTEVANWNALGITRLSNGCLLAQNRLSVVARAMIVAPAQLGLLLDNKRHLLVEATSPRDRHKFPSEGDRVVHRGPKFVIHGAKFIEDDDRPRAYQRM